MSKVLCVLTFLLLSSAAFAEDSHLYLTHPFFWFIAPHKGIEASKETLQNMRIGCAATVKTSVELKDCLDLAEKLYALVSLSSQEIKHAELVGEKIPKEEREALLEEIDKKFDEIKAVRDQIVERYPYVRFYIAPEKRIAL